MLYDKIITREPIDKGWSGDRKFRAVTDSGDVFLLRISPAEKQARVFGQFSRMCRAAALGIPMCLPVERGICPEGVYVLHSWIEGRDAETVLPQLGQTDQYRYGLDAGGILRKLHSLPAPADTPAWADRFSQKIDRKIAMYARCPLKYPGGEAFLRHIENFRHLLTDRPQSFQHGDYHTGNMMIDGSGKLTIIDFDRDDFGDPWEEFNRIVWCAQIAPHFASGMVDGYFAGPVPQEFWQLLALYISSNTLGSLPWAIPYGEEQVRVMQAQAAEVLLWYGDFHTVIPSWYRHP